MSFDVEPDGDPHGECALEIKKLNERIQELEGENYAFLEGSQEWEESFHQAKALEKAAIEKWQRYKKERDKYKELAESWMKDYDTLKNKYEPLVAVLSENESPEKHGLKEE